MRVSRGEVVLVDYPYSDRTGSKVRPCLVIQNDRSNQRLADTIVVTISSRVHRISEPTQLLIDVSTPIGAQSGLLFSSAVQCQNVLTIDCKFVIRKIGTLPPAAMLQINQCLKEVLGIS